MKFLLANKWYCIVPLVLVFMLAGWLVACVRYNTSHSVAALSGEYVE